MFSLLNVGLETPEEAVDPPLDGADVVVETVDLVVPVPRNLPREPEDGRSA